MPRASFEPYFIYIFDINIEHSDLKWDGRNFCIKLKAYTTKWQGILGINYKQFVSSNIKLLMVRSM